MHDPAGACLLPDVVPGDLVRWQEYGRRRGVRRGRVIALEHAGPGRIAPSCLVADRCGGCSLQFLDPSRHAEIKSAWVHDAFRHAMDDASEWLPVFGPDSEVDSRRRRLRWHIDRSAEGGLIVGFRARASDEIVAASHCMVITPELECLRQHLINNLDAEAYAGLHALRAMQLHDGIHAVLECGPDVSSPPCPELPDCGLPVQWWWSDGVATRPLSRPVLALHDRLPTRGGAIDVRIGPDDFIQGQAAGNSDMIRQLLAWGEDARRVADLFAGAGNLSLPLAAGGARIAGAEVMQPGVQAGNANAKRLGLQAHYRQANLFQAFDVSSYVGADLLIVDPPRRGAKQVCRLMNRLLPAKVVLVHCDVASGGRDAAIMREQGFRLRALRALDLFPWSGHVESLSLWTR